MSDLIFARSPFTIKHTSVADPPPPVYECYNSNNYGRFARFENFSVNSAGAIQTGNVIDNATGASLTVTSVTSTSGATSFPTVTTATTVSLRVTFNIPSGFSASSHTCEIEVTQGAATPTCIRLKLFNFSAIHTQSDMVFNYTDCSNASQSGTLSGANSTTTIDVKHPYLSNFSYFYSVGGVLAVTYQITDAYIAANKKVIG